MINFYKNELLEVNIFLNTKLKLFKYDYAMKIHMRTIIK